MKRNLFSLILILSLLFSSFALAEPSALCDCEKEQILKAVQYCNALPKSSQITYAAQYYGKVEGYGLQAVLLQCTQTDFMSEHFGSCASLLLLDTETGMVITFQNHIPQEGKAPDSKIDALHILFSHFDSYMRFQPEQVYSDAELLFPLSEQEIAEINAALQAHFQKPSVQE